MLVCYLTGMPKLLKCTQHSDAFCRDTRMSCVCIYDDKSSREESLRIVQRGPKRGGEKEGA
jgi:hypothetical protein